MSEVVNAWGGECLGGERLTIVGRYRAARVAKIITLSPPCGCCSVISVGLGRRHDCRITLTISTSPTEDMFQDKKKQCPKIKRFPKISQSQSYHLRLMD